MYIKLAVAGTPVGGATANYITFNGEEAGWRIISVEADGTIKIIRNGSIEDQVWNKALSNNWAGPATLNTYLNSTYKNLTWTVKMS